VISGQAAVCEIYLALKDNGEGLEPDQAQAVFDPFYWGDKSRSRDTGGTGLGLAIVKAIIAGHRGRVEASSQGKMKGSCFSLHLPV
jgi:signal transduction histidine kinase